MALRQLLFMVSTDSANLLIGRDAIEPAKRRF